MAVFACAPEIYGFDAFRASAAFIGNAICYLVHDRLRHVPLPFKRQRLSFRELCVIESRSKGGVKRLFMNKMPC